MTDVMIDIETVGTVPGCGILTVAAVPLDFSDFFYQKVSIKSCYTVGLFNQQSTLEWWDITSILTYLSEWLAYLRKKDSKGKLRVWGNSAAFDISILEAAYEIVKLKPEWNYKEVMCYRTLKNLFPNIPAIKPEIAHNALSDATAQAKHLKEILNAILLCKPKML